MAGHSKFANIKHRKGAQDKKRASMFTKLAREIVVAAKIGGGDMNFNPRLRGAVIAARAQNMPKDKIEAAIKKGSDPADGDNYDEMRYEGYAPGGIALIIDVLTDNKNRSASDIRTILSKNGGSLGESGCVSYMFDRVGMVKFKAEVASEDAMFEAALEAGAGNCESSDEEHEVTCEADQLNEVSDALTKQFGDPEASRLSWKAQTLIEVDDLEKAQKIINLVDLLEDNDDVQYVSANFDIPDAIAEQLE